MFKVQLANGEITDYDTKRLMVSLIRALATPDQALKVTMSVESWLVAKNSEIVNSSEIRAKVVEELNNVDPELAHAYEICRKSQESGQK